jgi:hypothetical protein
MVALQWDLVGERLFETGVDKGVLYLPNNSGVYNTGYAWNGLETVTESPSGAEVTPTYADNIKYLNLLSIEEFGGTIEAYTYPNEFAQCDGSAQPEIGVSIGQQNRRTFGLSYRTRLGNDTLLNDYGYKLHLVYGALAMPSEKAYSSVNDSPEPVTFSWEFSTTPVPVGTIGLVTYKPTASLVIDSTKVNASALTNLEQFLYGTSGTDPSLPLPAAVVALFAGTVTSVTPTAPTYDAGTDLITIPSVTGVIYKVNGVTVPSGAYGPITQNTVVTAVPAAGYIFPVISDDDWFFAFS